MAHFIELTDINDAKIVVNVDNVLWFEKYDEDSSVIFFSLDGRNDVPFNMIVRENQEAILREVQSKAYICGSELSCAPF